MSSTDKKMERAIDARVRKVGRAFVHAGILDATYAQKLEVLVRLLMDRSLGLANKNMSDWPASKTISRLLA